MTGRIRLCFPASEEGAEAAGRKRTNQGETTGKKGTAGGKSGATRVTGRSEGRTSTCHWIPDFNDWRSFKTRIVADAASVGIGISGQADAGSVCDEVLKQLLMANDKSADSRMRKLSTLR
jgi:hypothetical protein